MAEMNPIPDPTPAKPALATGFTAGGNDTPVVASFTANGSKTASKTNGNNGYGKLLEEVGYPQSFVYLLAEAMHQSERSNIKGALLVVSIDNLSMVMCGYGHEIAEIALKHIRQEIGNIVGDNDHVQRIQRDQFGVILRNTNQQEVAHISERIISMIHHYSCYSNYGSLHIVCSLGHVLFPDQCNHPHEALDKIYVTLNETAEETLANADTDAETVVNLSRQQMGMASYLGKAIKENRLKLAYQPIIDSKTGGVAHYEALLRLYGEDGKIGSAGALIPVAERMGLIHMIDELTLGMVVNELRQAPNVSIALNVSNLTTKTDKWLQIFNEYIEETPEIASRLTVEITETSAVKDLRRSAYFVAAVQATGASVALDDFGSGYTSFRQLKTLSVDTVKIDGAFIRDLVENPDSRLFVKTLIDFAKGFGLATVAEFVETGEIAKILMELGADYMQGYYFGKPDNVRRWLKEGEYKKS